MLVPQTLAEREDDLELEEVGDGNLNDVVRVTCDQHSIIAKHAPPYVKVITEGVIFDSSVVAMDAMRLPLSKILHNETDLLSHRLNAWIW